MAAIKTEKLQYLPREDYFLPSLRILGQTIFSSAVELLFEYDKPLLGFIGCNGCPTDICNEPLFWSFAVSLFELLSMSLLFECIK